MANLKYNRGIMAESRCSLQLIAVLKKRQLFEKQLRKAQSKLKYAGYKWREVKKCSDFEDLEQETLFLKSKYNKPVYLEKTVLANGRPAVRNGKTGAQQPMSSICQGSTIEDYILYPMRKNNKRDIKPKLQTKSPKYNTRGIDESESDEDFAAYTETPAKEKDASAFGWLHTKLKNAKKTNSKKKFRPKLNIENNKNCEDDSENGNKDDNNQEKRKLTTNVPKSRETGLLSGVKTGLSKVLTKLSNEKGTRKKDLICIEDNDTENSNQICEEDHERQLPVPKKKQKRDDAKVACPLCDRKFNENEINEHAFTCNGEQPNITRKQRERLDDTLDFIPLETRSSSNKGQQKSSKAKTQQSNDYSEWEMACQKVDMGKVKNVPMSQLLNENVQATSSEPYFKKLCKDSEKICNDASSKDRSEKVSGSKILQRDKVRSTDAQKDIMNWLSDESESQDANKSEDFLNQYLKPEQIAPKTKKRKLRINMKKRRRARILDDDDDSIGDGDNIEKCFICSKTFPTGAVYNAHVNECVTKEEANNNYETGKPSTKADNKRQSEDALHKRLGNRKSWAPFDGLATVGANDNGNSNEKDDENIKADSPIQTYKPVGESSLFNFENQFRNTSNKRDKLSTKTYMKRKKRF